MMRLARWCILGVVLIPLDVWGQPLFSWAAPLRVPVSLSGNFYLLHFHPLEGSTGNVRFMAPAYGLTYARPDFEARVLYGPATRRSEEHRLFEGAFLMHSPVTLFRDDRVWWSVLLGLQGAYRSVRDQSGRADAPLAFQAVSLLVEAGPALLAHVGNWQFEGKATYALGISSRPFSSQTGKAAHIEAGFRLHVRDVILPYGLTIGYAYRVQEWDITPSVFASPRERKAWRYRDRMQVISLGINWQ